MDGPLNRRMSQLDLGNATGGLEIVVLFLSEVATLLDQSDLK